MVKKIAVFCGQYEGNDSRYSEAARLLARTMAENNIELIYGGANVGLMGILANEMLALGGKVTGVMPSALVDKEIAHPNITNMHIVETMHARKNLIISMSDAFILFPGGIGSLDEFFEVFTLGKLGMHHKPFGILNVGNFFGLLIEFIKHTVIEGFLENQHHQMVVIENDPAKLVERLLQTKTDFSSDSPTPSFA